ncbi:MAG: inositol monophosphatase, partial [Acidimicrobiia bacterium]|nr:inositol monophosphatase [Acidimicrobiia bacterium]
GAAVVGRAFGGGQDADYKGRFDPVTATDRASEDAILAVLGAERPGDAILAEESGGTPGDGRHWIVDPLDGTVNFVHGIPHIAVSVALYDGPHAIVGVVHDVVRNEVFAAQAGAGATVDGDPLAVSRTNDLGLSVVATGFPYDHDVRADALAAVVRDVLRSVNGIRRFGSAALDLAWVAAGRYDAYWELGIAPWDGAAGLLIVREAGGRVTDPHGKDSTPFMPLVVSSNGSVHESLRSLIEPHVGSFEAT